MEELLTCIANCINFANAVKNSDKQVPQITFNDNIRNIVAAMLEEKTKFVQIYVVKKHHERSFHVDYYG